MPAKSVKLYPVKGHYLADVPRVVQTIATKADADRLVKSGAFTANPNDAERDSDVPDESGEPVEPARTSQLGEEAPDEPGPSDLEKTEE